MSEKLPPRRRIRWSKIYRVIPSRYPPVDLFERIADPSDWEMIAEIEGLTNDRLRQEAGDISLVPVHERISGPGSSPVMAAFTHIGSQSRFSDGSYGVYYAANRIEVAITEVAFNLTGFYRSTKEPPFRSEHRSYVSSLNAVFHDIRNGWAEAHDPDSYVSSQALARHLRSIGSNGVVYRSVRYPGGNCVGAFRPKAIGQIKQHKHFYFQWDGERISRYICIGDENWQELP